MTEQDNTEIPPVDLNPVVQVLADSPAPPVPSGASAMTILVTLPPGSPGTPPHRHSGPAFGYVIEGEMLFELEGSTPVVLRAGEAFSEPGGDLIHYSDANNLKDAQTQFVVTMFCAPGQPMLVPVSEQELMERAHKRSPRH